MLMLTRTLIHSNVTVQRYPVFPAKLETLLIRFAGSTEVAAGRECVPHPFATCLVSSPSTLEPLKGQDRDFSLSVPS